jgi:hypothetical protein
MSIKILNKIIFFILLIGIVPLSCSKFEDGPYFSLLTTKQRLSREWKVQYSIDLQTGISHSADFEGWLLSFSKNGTFTNSIIYNQEQINYSGKWEIIGKNQIRFEYQIESGTSIQFYTILRLTKKELWLNDLKEEIHYYSD